MPRFLLALLLGLNVALTVDAYNWDEISQEELAATECTFDTSAEAEVLFKSLIYDLTDNNIRVIKTHIRTKIYDKSALDRARRTKFYYYNYYKAANIHARVIKPDGSYIEVDDKDVVTQTESKKNGDTLKSTTISIPQVEVGDIVEYKYRRVMDEYYYLPKDQVSFQEAWPIRKLELKMKPYVYKGAGFKWTSNKIAKRMEKGKGGFYEITLENQPGYPDEPYQAPDTDAKSWFAFYNVTSLSNGDAFWKGESKRLHKQMLSMTKNDKVVSAKAAELSAGKSTDEEKLQAFYDYCTHDLINAYYGEADRLTADQRNDLDSKWSASKVISKGYGTAKNMNTVFCALARSIGIDARLSACANRNEYAFTKVMEQIDIALPHSVVGIKNEDTWTFYNPGCRYIPFGQLDWIHDNVVSLVPDKKDVILTRTQAASPEQNSTLTKGRFELSIDGELSGKVTLIGEGNPGLALKQILDGQSKSERIKSLKKALSKPWPNGDMENFVIKNAAHPTEPLTIEFDITIPNYAETVGDRIFVQTNVEQRFAEAEFPSPERKTSIFFNYKYQEKSDIRIKLPEGYALEAPSAPKPLEFKGLLNYEPKLAMSKKTNTLIYKRTLDFIGNRFPPKAYPAIKYSFDQLLAQDHHALTLKKQEASASTVESTSSES